MHSNDTSKRSSKKLSLELKEPEENVNRPSRKESRKQLMAEKDPSEKNSVEQRVHPFPVALFIYLGFPIGLLTVLCCRENIMNERWKKYLYVLVH